jgi:hypothetical protein
MLAWLELDEHVVLLGVMAGLRSMWREPAAHRRSSCHSRTLDPSATHRIIQNA